MQQPCRLPAGRLTSVLAGALLAAALAWSGSLRAQAPPANLPISGQDAAKKRPGAPFLRIERVQACLKDLNLYGGPLTGIASTATSRAVHRLIQQRDPALHKTLARPGKGSEELSSRAVQAHLRETCRASLARIDRDRVVDPEDRCGTAARYSPVRKACICIEGHARYDGLCLPRVDAATRTAQSAAPVPVPRLLVPERPMPALVVPPAAASVTLLEPTPVKPAVSGVRSAAEVSPVTCLPSDLKALLPRRGAQRNALPVCELPCLSPPAGMKAADLRQYEQEAGIAWCDACIPFNAYLPLDDVERIERAGNLTLCREAPRTAVNLEASVRPDGLRIFKGARALFARRQAAVPHGNVAVIVTLQGYRPSAMGGLTGSAHAARDGTAMRALLSEQLGYQNDNIIELKDAALTDLVRLFGSAAGPKGELWERMNARGVAPGATLLVYISGLGAFRAADPGAFLLPVDAERGREEASGYPLARLIDNLARLGAAATTVLLEVDFSRRSGQMVLTPNVPEAADPLLAAGPKGAIAMLTAADRDQRTLEDPEYGIGLFTRHVITGLSGAADLAPIGNGDNAVDPLELHVHTAYRVGLAARRSFGVTQKPSLLRSHPLPVAHVSEIVN